MFLALDFFFYTVTKTNTGTHANLGVLHEDDAEKLNWYRRAAKEGDPDAQSTLGLMYFTGRGVLQDYAEAHKWFNLAASRYSTSDIRSRDQARSVSQTPVSFRRTWNVWNIAVSLL